MALNQICQCLSMAALPASNYRYLSDTISRFVVNLCLLLKTSTIWESCSQGMVGWSRRSIEALSTVIVVSSKSVMVKKKFSFFYCSVYFPCPPYSLEIWIMADRKRAWILACEECIVHRLARLSFRDEVHSSVSVQGKLEAMKSSLCSFSSKGVN